MKQRNEQESYSRNVGFEYRAEFSGNNILYEGWAFPTSFATDESALIWQIIKHTHDADGNLTKSSWANYNDAFDKSWILRANYLYA